MNHELAMWVIYEHPSDHPESYVVRQWHVGAGVVRASPAAHLFDTLAQAREFIPPSLVRLGRARQDEPQILEVWL